MNRKHTYRVVNIVFLMIAFCLLFKQFQKINALLGNRTLDVFLLLLVTAVLVHGLKGMRLYLALYEKHIPLGLFIRQYCKVIPVSMILPFKIGDLFRAYCFGYHMQDYLAGIAVILFDRFVDTIALVSIILGLHLLISVNFNLFFYLLIIALVFLLGVYYICPGMCKYWLHFLLLQDATKNRIRIIRFLSGVQKEFAALQQVVNGKFFITFVLSLIAWIIEIGGMFIACSYILKLDWTEMVQEYLSGALFGVQPLYLTGFICMSIVLLFCLYFIAAITFLCKKGEVHE